MTLTQYADTVKTALANATKARATIAELEETDKGLIEIPALKRARVALFDAYKAAQASIDGALKTLCTALEEVPDDAQTMPNDFIFPLMSAFYYAVSDAQEKALTAHIRCVALHLKQLERDADLPRLLKLPNNPAERDMHRALSLYPAWQKNENLCTRYHEGREKTTVVFQPPEILQSFNEAPEKALRALDARFSNIKSETTADVIDILFHHWKAHKSEAQGGRAAITLRRVCEYRGVIPKGDNLDLHWRAMRDARAIRLTGGGVDAALFDMDSFNLFGADETPDKDMAYFYQPGYLIQYGLETNRLYDAYFLENIWRLDPFRNAEAKKLARFLRGEWRLNPESYLNPKPNGRCWRTWRELLAEAGQFPDQWDSEDRNTARKIKGIEKAINTLYDLEFLAETGTAIYHSDDRRLLDNLPRKGRLKAWLELRVCLLPAADIREALEDVSARRITRRERDAKALADAKARATVRAEKPRRRAKSDAQK